MAKLDVLKLEEELSNITGISSIDNNKFFQVICNIAEQIEEQIKVEIRKTDTYKELEELYKNYIVYLGNFFRRVGITKSTEVAVFHSKLCKKGYLSHNKEFVFTNNDIKGFALYEVEQIAGSKIATGKSLCRHIAPNLTDLQNEIGNSSINIMVKDVGNITKYFISLLKILPRNHAVVITKAQDLLYGYCPISNTFFELSALNGRLLLSEKDVDGFKKMDYYYIGPKQYIDFDSVMFEYNNDNIKLLESLIIDNSLLDDDRTKIALPNYEVAKAYNNIDAILEEGIDEIEDFYSSTKDQLSRISQLATDLYPKEVSKKGKILQYTIR